MANYHTNKKIKELYDVIESLNNLKGQIRKTKDGILLQNNDAVFRDAVIVVLNNSYGALTQLVIWLEQDIQDLLNESQN